MKPEERRRAFKANARVRLWYGIVFASLTAIVGVIFLVQSSKVHILETLGIVMLISAGGQIVLMIWSYRRWMRRLQ